MLLTVCAVSTPCRLKPELENVAVTSELLTDDGRIKIMNYIKYLLFNNGPLATTGCDRGAFVNTRGKTSTFKWLGILVMQAR